MSQFGWVIDLDNCIGCRACEGACKQEWKLPTGVRRRRVLVQEGQRSDGTPFRRFVTSACMHCENPACIQACPQSNHTNINDSAGTAIFKDATTGLVIPQAENCIGCRRCASACPYGAPQFDPSTGKMDKCNGCYHRLANNDLAPTQRMPACVLTCSSYALSFSSSASFSAPDARANGAGAPTALKDISDPTKTRPMVRFTKQRGL
ncbi:MAG: 4Fe-4S dicluster domain-containing protein [Deltaproteobacteria bacterium]|nr:4Fe-4S dicluster domain-containing protein [Deltaproteobacteria bacterium]